MMNSSLPSIPPASSQTEFFGTKTAHQESTGSSGDRKVTENSTGRAQLNSLPEQAAESNDVKKTGIFSRIISVLTSAKNYITSFFTSKKDKSDELEASHKTQNPVKSEEQTEADTVQQSTLQKSTSTEDKQSVCGSIKDFSVLPLTRHMTSVKGCSVLIIIKKTRLMLL